MKKNIRAAVLGSALILIGAFTGCADKPVQMEELAKGGYVESVMKTDLNVFSLSEIELLNNKLVTYDSLLGKEIVISDSELNSNDSDILKKMQSPNKFTTILACSDNGFLVSKTSRDNYDTEYFTVSSEGKENKIEVSSDYINYAEYSSEGRLFIIYSNSLCEIMNNNTIKPLLSTGQNVVSLDIVGDNVIFIDENGVHFYDINNEKENEVPKALSVFFDKYVNKIGSEEIKIDMCQAYNDSICIACSDGIFRYILNGNNVEQLVDGVSCSLGNPSLKLSSVYCSDNESIVVVFDDGTVCHFKYDPNLNNEKNAVLKIYSLEKNEILSQLINGYSSLNKNISVDYQIGMKDGLSYEDAVKEFTTQVLSGNAPDVIMLDGMDIDNYIEKNMLCDLSMSEKTWNKENKLIDNVVKWNKKGDKFYNVACKFCIPAIGADSDVLKNLNSFGDIADSIKESRKKYNDIYPLMYFYKPEYIVKTGLIYEGGDIIRNGKIETEKLKEFFNNCTVIYENNENKKELITYGGYGDESAFIDRMINVIQEDHTIAIGTVNTFDYDLNILESLNSITPDNNAEYKFGIGNNSGVFVPKCNLGIIGAGKNHEDAEKFIAYALDTEPQKLSEKNGFPVNTDTLDFFYRKNEMDINNYYGYDFSSLDESKTYIMDVKWINNSQAKDFSEFINSLDTPFTIDKATEQIIIEAGIDCMEGSISLDEAVKNAVNQLELKMKE